MKLAEATARALKAVLGTHLKEYRKAQMAFRAGSIDALAFEPMKRDFTNAVERRLDTVVGEIKAALRGTKAQACAGRVRAGGRVAPCPLTATTIVAGKPYCDAHAEHAPRLSMPGGRAA